MVLVIVKYRNDELKSITGLQRAKFMKLYRPYFFTSDQENILDF